MGWLELGAGIGLALCSACSSKPACIEGQSVACACPSGKGAQTCNANGTFSPCSCGGFDDLAAAAEAMDHSKKWKKTEASLQLNKILKNAKVAFNTTSSFVVGTSAVLPGPPGHSCAAAGGKFPVTTAWTSDPVWAALDIQIDEPNLFSYQYIGTPTSATVVAIGDLDCDGVYITYTLNLTAPGGNATGTIVEPPPNND